jgi:hypothetical protein
LRERDRNYVANSDGLSRSGLSVPGAVGFLGPVAGEADVLATEGCHVLEQAEWDRGAAASERVDSALKIPRVPNKMAATSKFSPDARPVFE